MQAYPSLTDSEFVHACQMLERSCYDRLNESSWARVDWAQGELKIQQVRRRPLETGSEAVEEEQDLDSSMIEEQDKEIVNRHKDTSSTVVTDFSIVLSPTYQVPVLWFSFLSDIPTSSNRLETVYDIIVSPTSRQALQNIGVLGGISIANHPKRDVPAFFIHPCRTSEVLEKIRPEHDVSPIEYLMLWFGIIGSAVGLSIPSDVAASFRP